MPAMTKKKKVVSCLVIPIIFIAVGFIAISIFLFPRPGKIEITENHPFKSAEAKEKYLSFMKEHEKQTWPIDSEKVTVNTSFGETFVRISGPESAPPLVLLHGGGSNSLGWFMNIEAFSARYRTYAIDTIGDYGFSIYTKFPQGADDYSKWLDELFDSLPLEKDINLLGISAGGFLASQYAIRHQDRLNKLVLLASAGIVQAKMEAIVRVVISMLPFKITKGAFTSWLLEDLRERDEALFKRIVRAQEITRQCFKAVPSVMPEILSDQELQSLNIPVLVLIGENDEIFSANNIMERLEKINPSIQKHLIPNAGHTLNTMESEFVNSTVLQFLNKKQGAKKQK